MPEGHRAMVRIVLLDQHMAVEPSHLLDREDPDPPEGTGRHRKDLPLRQIRPQLRVRCGLETVEGDLAGSDIPLQGPVGDLHREGTGHDHLVLHLTGRQLGGAGVAAVEAHEGVVQGIVELALDRLLVHILRHRVVDIQQGHHIVRYAGTDIL